MALLTYVDESYTNDWYCMVALLLDGPAAVSLSSTLDDVASKAATAYGMPADVELHGYEMMNGKKDWSALPGVRARIGVCADVVKAVASEDVQVVARAIDRVGQRRKYPTGYTAHTVVLQHLLERVDECVTDLGEYALVIADEVDEQAQHRADLSQYKTDGTRAGVLLTGLSTRCTSRRATSAGWFRLLMYLPTCFDECSRTTSPVKRPLAIRLRCGRTWSHECTTTGARSQLMVVAKPHGVPIFGTRRTKGPATTGP